MQIACRDALSSARVGVLISYNGGMPKTTPFHDTLAPYNETGVWKHWFGTLAAPRYQYSATAEYYAVRNSVAVFDTSPLFKYRIAGAGAVRLLETVMARDIHRCKVGFAQYTCWCDEQGFVLQDGVVMRLKEDEFWLTAAEPSLHYFLSIAEKLGLAGVTVEDITDAYGVLAVQGPHSLSTLSRLTDAGEALKFFELKQVQIEGADVVVSRTGYTGDLGYELWVPAEHAGRICKRLFEVGADYNIVPLGLDALKMARVEAGLLLMDVDFHSSRYAWVDAQRESPIELGWGWMFSKLDDDPRAFIGRDVIEQQLNEKTNRWTTVGLSVDWHDYERVHLAAGIRPDKHDNYCESTHSIYRRGGKEWDYAGYASSFLFSSILKKPIAIAKLPNDLSAKGTEVDLEIPIIRKPKNVLARVTRMPFYNPSRKTSKPAERIAQ